MTPAPIEEQIRRVIVLSAQLIDDKRFEEWSELFAEDGRFVVRGLSLVGRQAIVTTIAPMMEPVTTKHMVAWPIVDLVDEHVAHVWTDLTTFAQTEGGTSVATIGRYHDELRRGDDQRWRLTSRVLVPTGDAPPEDVRRSPGA